MKDDRELLRLNVGFIIHETIGYFRDFIIDFPELHLQPDVDLRDFKGTIRVTRTAQGLLMQARLNALTRAECVRCLTPLWQLLETDFTELFAFSPNSVTESGLYVPETGKLDLAPLVRDEMLVAVPITSLCKPDCKGLCPVCGENLNDRDHKHAEEPENPRLSSLKSLLDKEN